MSRRRQKAEDPTTLIGYHAGFVSRLSAFVIDILIISGINLAITTISYLVASSFGLDFLFTNPTDTTPNWMLTLKLMAIVALLVTSFLVIVFYPILFWVTVGQTPGKRFMGLRVVTEDNSKQIYFSMAVKRYLGYWVSGLPLFLGFIWVLVDDNRQTWHDKFADTYVIYDWDARYNNAFVNTLQNRGAKRADKSKFVRNRLHSGSDE